MVGGHDHVLIPVFLEHVLEQDHQLFRVAGLAAIFFTAGALIRVEPPLRVNHYHDQARGELDHFGARTSVVGHKDIAPVEVFLYIVFLALDMLPTILAVVVPVMITWNEYNLALEIFDRVELDVDPGLILGAHIARFFVQASGINIVPQKDDTRGFRVTLCKLGL